VFAATKARYDASADKKDIDTLPMIGVVVELEHERVQESSGE